jgi:hypothetical protein
MSNPTTGSIFLSPLASLSGAERSEFLQIRFRSRWDSEPNPPLAGDVRSAVHWLRTQLNMDRHQFCRLCSIPMPTLLRLEGVKDYKINADGIVQAYALSSQAVFLKLAEAAANAMYPKHALYFRKRAEEAAARLHAPRRRER